MKFKKKILIPLALFAMFSMDYKQAFAFEENLISTKTNLVDIIAGQTSYGGSTVLTDGNISTYQGANDFGLTGGLFEFGAVHKVYEIHVKMFKYAMPVKILLADGTWKNISADKAMTSGGWTYFNFKEMYGVDYLEATAIDLYYNDGSVDVAEVNVFADAPDNKAPAPVSNLSYVFGDDNSVTYTYDLPNDPDFSHIEVYQDAQLIKDDYKGASLKITDLLPETNYNFHFYALDNSGNKSIVKSSTIQMPAGPDLIAPQNITSVQNVVSDTSIQFSYLLPIDSDFSHLQVYRNNQLIAPNVQLASFVDEGLEYETSYTYSFKSVDTSGNISEGTTLTVQTMPYNDLIAPSAPTGLDVLTGNSSLALSWFPNPENDVQGYNVYVDGVKRNGAPVFGNSYSLTNLANANEYSIQISAVDTNGNESVLTAEKIAIPDGSKIPFFKLDNDLTDVVESTENWFSEMWLIVAFSAGIPLAFVVGNRIKSLFFA